MRDKNKYVQKDCLFCNKPFFVLITRSLNLGRNKYCSKRCYFTGKFKRGRYLCKKGYIVVSILENGKINQYYEHRQIYEAWLGSKLKTLESVHHIDGDMTNNDIANLELMSHGDHVAFHFKQIKKKKNLRKYAALTGGQK